MSKAKREEYIDLDVVSDLISFGEKSYPLITNKPILYLIGPSGVGKTTTLLWLSGKVMTTNEAGKVIAKEPKDDDIGRIGLQMKSETRAINAKQQGKLVFVDGAGNGDSEGYSVDLANLVCVNKVFELCSTVVPVFLISFIQITADTRGILLRNICKYIGNMFGNDLDKALNHLHIFFSHAKGGSLAEMMEYCKGVVEADSNENTPEVIKILYFIMDTIETNGPQVKIVDPASDARMINSRTLKNYFENQCVPLDNPKAVCKFAIPTELSLALHNSLLVIKNGLPLWIQKQDFQCILKNLITLQKLSEKIPAVQTDFKECVKIVCLAVSAKQEEVMARFRAMVDNISLWLSGDIESFNEFMKLLEHIEPIRDFLSTDICKLDAFQKYHFEILKTLLNKTEAETDFVQMKLITQKLMNFAGSVSFGEKFSIRLLVEQAQNQVRKKVLALKKSLAEKDVFSVQTEEAIRLNLDGLYHDLEMLQAAAFAIKDIVTDIDCKIIINETTQECSKKLSVLQAELLTGIKSLSTTQQAEPLRMKCTILKEVSRHSGLNSYFENLTDIWKSSKNLIITEGKTQIDEIATSLTSSDKVFDFKSKIDKVHGILAVDNEIKFQLGLEFSKLISQLEEKVNNYVTKIEAELEQSNPNYETIERYLSMIKKNLWLDAVSFGMGSIKDKFDNAKSYLLSKIRHMENSIIWNWKRTKYEAVAAVIEQFELTDKLADILGEEYLQLKMKCCSHVEDPIEEELKTITKRAHEKPNDSYSFWRINQDLENVHEFTLVCKVLGIKKNIVCSQTLKQHANEKAKLLLNKISDVPTQFREQNSILETLHAASKLSKLTFLSEETEKAKNKVLVHLDELEHKIKNYLAENDYSSAFESFSTFTEARSLISFFPDIIARCTTLQNGLISAKDISIQRIPEYLKLGHWGKIKAELSQNKAESPNYKQMILDIETHLRKKISIVESTQIQFALLIKDDFNVAAYQELKESLLHLRDAQLFIGEKLAIGLDESLKEFYSSLDKKLAQAINSNILRYQNKQFALAEKLHERFIAVITAFPDKLTASANLLELYKTETDRFWTDLVVDIDPNLINPIYEGLQPSSVVGFMNLKIKFETKIKECVAKKLTEAKSMPLYEANQQLEVLIGDLNLLPAELNKSLIAEVNRTKSLISRRSENDVSSFGILLTNPDLTEAKTIYSSSETRDSELKMKYDTILKQKSEILLRELRECIVEKNAVMICEKLKEYLKFSTFSAFPAFTNTSVYKSLKMCCDQQTAKLQQENESMETSVEFPERVVAIIIFLAQILGCPFDMVEPKILAELLRPTIAVLASVDRHFTIGVKSCDFGELALSLEKSKQLVPLVKALCSLTIEDPHLTELKLEVNKMKKFETLKAETEAFVQQLESDVKESWYKKKFDVIARVLRKLSGILALDKFIPRISNCKQKITQLVTDLYTEQLRKTKNALNVNNIEEFNENYGLLIKAAEIQEILKIDGLTELTNQIQARIKQIVDELNPEGDNAAISSSMIELHRMGEEIPSSELTVKMEMSKFLNKLSSLKITQISAALPAEGRLGNEIIDKYSQFSNKKVELWIQKTQGQGIKYAIDKMEVVQTTPTGGMQSIFNVFKAPLSALASLINPADLERDYNTFEYKFKDLVNTHSISGKSNNYAALIAITKGMINRLDHTPHIVLAHIFAVWSLVKSNVNTAVANQSGVFWLKPHPVQYLTLLQLLKKQDNKYQNQLVQILTGEGKSVILGILSVIYGLLGYDVNCICYSEYLSMRDLNDFLEIFNLFDIQKSIVYSTVYEMCNHIINSNGNVRQLTHKFIHEDTSNSPMQTVVKKNRVLLIDEVDEFFGSSFLGNSYNPATRVQNDLAFELLQKIWSSKKLITTTQAENLPAFQNLVKQFPTWKTLFQTEVRKMIKDVNLYLDNSPMVYNNKVGYALQDSVSTTIVYGYKTAFAYFHFKETGQITDESVKENVGIYLSCGSFSFAEIPRNFDLILGVSGTLKSLCDEEKDIMSGYKITKVSYAPSMYGDPRRVEEPTVVISDRDQWFLRIVQVVQDKINAGRAALIFFADNEILKEFHSKYGSNSFKGLVQILNEETQYKDSAVKKATISGTVTLSPRVFGRGVDFICRDPATRSANGVFVVQTFVSISEAESIQIKGRCARQGDPGSYQLILLEADLASINITPEKVKSATDISKLIQEHRNVVYVKNVKELVKKSQEVLIDHNETQKFYSLLLSYAAQKTPQKKTEIQDFILKLNQCKTASATNFHLYFCLDESGSMSGQPWKDLIFAVEACISKRIDLCLSSGCTPSDLVTIVNYGSSARVMCSGVPINSQPHTKTNFGGGGTCFSAGLRQVQQEMRKMSQGFVPVLLFMSDGGSGDGETEIVAISKEFKNVEIYIVGFGTGCSASKMQNMANISGGKYYFGSDGINLVSAFETISVSLSQKTFSV